MVTGMEYMDRVYIDGIDYHIGDFDFLENVTEFQTWCPVKRNGQPDMSRKGWRFL